MTDIQQATLEELAEDVFLKNEVLKAHLARNVPTDFDARRAAFIELAIARDAANKASNALETRLRPPPAPGRE